MRLGIRYLVGQGTPAPLYVSLTNRCNTATIISSRGPGFGFGKKFTWLEDVSGEPTAEELAQAVSGARGDPAFTTWDHRTVVFAGGGEPLLRAPTLEATCAHLLGRCENLQQERGKAEDRAEETSTGDRASYEFRVVTNGLFPRSVVRSALAGNVSKATIAINGHSENVYSQIMQPDQEAVSRCLESNASCARGGMTLLPGGSYVERIPGQGGLSVVQDFVLECRAAGLCVEVTCVDRPGVDLARVEAFAASCGASFRAREFFP